MPDTTAEVDWRTLGQPQFDRIVHSILHAEFPDDVVQPLDGRGGDGGVDVLVEHRDGQNTVFELKYFPEGFTGGFATTRRKQIRSSYRRCVQTTNPDRWVLVFPGVPTASERVFVDKLGTSDDEPAREIWGEDMLDKALIKHPEIASYHARPQLEAMVATFGQEVAFLSDPVDAIGRISKLADAINSVDPDWDLGFKSDTSGLELWLAGKHSGATLAGQIVLRPSALTDEQRAALERVHGYGASDLIRIGSPALMRMEVEGSQWIQDLFALSTNLEYRVGSAIHPGAPFSVAFGDGRGSFEGTLTHGGMGPEGISIEADLGLVQVRMLLPHSADAPGKMNFQYQLGESSSVTDVLQAAEFALCANGGGAVTVQLNHRDLVKVSLDVRPADATAVDEIHAKATDLDVLQRHCRQRFPFPLVSTYRDLATYRAARLLIEGKRVTVPSWWNSTVALSGEDNPGVRLLLTEAVGLRWPMSNLVLKAGGRQFELGPAYATAVVEAIDGAGALQDLDAGRAAGREVLVRPTEGRSFTAWLMDPSGDEQIRPLTLWDLREISEPGPDASQTESGA